MIEQWYLNSCTTWNHVLTRNAMRFPDKPLFALGDRTLTFAEFYEQVSMFARGLLRLGIGKNDVVAVWMTNSLEWVIAQFAVYKIGAMLLPVYTYYRRLELEYALQQAGVSALVMCDRFLGKIDARGLLCELVPEILTQQKEALSPARLPSLKTVIVVNPTERLPGRFDFGEVSRLGRNSASELELLRREIDIGPFDVMNIMYTSGTTGFPKAGMSMHITNLCTTTLWSELAGLTSDDVILCHVPLFTNFGCLYIAALGVLNACKIVITEHFDAAESLRLIQQERVSYLPAAPSMFRMMLDHPDLDRWDRSSLRAGHVGGAPLTEAGMREIIDVMGIHEMLQAYGLSECGGVATVTTSVDDFNKRLASVGKPLRSARIRIVDAETLAPLPAGKTGEIILGDAYPGSCVGKGYFRAPEKTAAAIMPDGWFRTGDFGHLDDEGFLYLAGRVDDMFTVGGFNIYPAEIETVLEQIPGVKQAFVVPMRDHRLLNVPAAWIALAPGCDLIEAAIVAYCKAQMAVQKVPRRVFFFTPGELPTTPSGKIRKKELTQRTAALLEKEL